MNFLIILILPFIVFADDQKEQKVEYVYLIFPEKCYNEIFNKSEYSIDCMADTASRALSVAIVGFAFLNQMPQIYKIVKYKSTQGLAFNSTYNESFLIAFNISYNLYKKSDFMLYGENVFVLAQFFIIMTLFLIYDITMTKFKFGMRMLLFWIINTPLLLGYGPVQLFNGVMYINMILLFVSRFPQIYMNWKNKSTGQMALLTQLQNQSGAMARIFTLFVSSTDALYISLVCEDNILSTIITSQICCYYKNKLQLSPIKYENIN